MHARRLQLIFASALLALSAILTGHGPAAARSWPLASPSSASLLAAPPALQYLGGFGGRLAGVAVNGTIAYVGEGSSLTLLDIADPPHPAHYARLPLDGVVEDIALAGDRLYVANTRGLQIFDVRIPRSPVPLGAFATSLPATRVKVAGDLAYLATDQLLVVDVHDPASPQQRGSYRAPYDDPINDIALAGARAYVAYGYASGPEIGLSIVDIGNPAAPAQLGVLELPNEQVLGVQAAGDLAYIITDASGSTPTGSRLLVVDAHNPASPAERGWYGLDMMLASKTTRMVVADGRAYVAAEYGGMLIVDVRNPDALVRIWQSEPQPGGSGLQLVGSLLFAAGNNDVPGLQIIDVSKPAAPAQFGSYTAVPAIVAATVTQGRAYLGDTSWGFQIADVSDVNRPTREGAYWTNGAPSQTQIVGNLAYTTGGNTGFHILDISDPQHPLRLGRLALNTTTTDLRVVGTLAYISGINSLQIVDVIDPAHPAIRGSYNHPTGADSGVDVVGNLVYFATGNAGLAILDVSDPAHPVERAIYTNLTRASDVAVAGDRAYVAADSGGLVILDISNPNSPQPLGSAHTPGHAYSVYVAGSLAYVSDTSGVQIVDVRNPADPALVAHYDLWGRVAVDGNLMYVAAGGAGLHIVRMFPERLPARAALGPAGGELTTIDGGVGLTLPAGALAGTTTLTITPALSGLPPIDGASVFRAATLEARAGDGQPVAQLGQPYTLAISYTDAQLAAHPVKESTLRLVYWDGAKWAAAPACAGCGVDTAANRARLTLDRPTTVALVGDPPLTVYLPAISGR